MLKIISIRKIQFETTLRCHHTPVRTAKVSIVIIPNVGRDAETLELSHIADENGKWHRHSEEQFSFLKN